jgi:hypothetical protein
MFRVFKRRKEMKMGGDCEKPAGTTKCWGNLRVHVGAGNDLHLHDDASKIRFNWKGTAGPSGVSGIESFRRVWKEVFLLVRCLMDDGDEFAFRGDACTNKGRQGVFVLKKNGTYFEHRLDAYDSDRKYDYEVSADEVIDGITECLDREMP